MARIIRQCTVVRDGHHNGFTDLLHWQGLYWAAYRKGAGHVSADGQAVIAFSADRHRWREVSSIFLPGDVRDPKLVSMGDRLACYFPVWLGGVAKRKLQQFVSFSDDGMAWSKPQACLSPYWWLWRVVHFGGKYYGAAYTYNDGGLVEGRGDYWTRWVVSDDMRQWRTLSHVGSAAQGLGEAGIHFFADGTVWLLSRRSRPVDANAWFARSAPPYTTWELTELDRMIHSPAMIEHKGAIYVAGRRQAGNGNEVGWPYATPWSMGVWRVEPGKVEPVLHIPASGDCGYPGLIVDPEGRVCMTYYSMHAYDMGVEPRVLREGANGAVEVQSAADVFFAELDLG